MYVVYVNVPPNECAQRGNNSVSFPSEALYEHIRKEGAIGYDALHGPDFLLSPSMMKIFAPFLSPSLSLCPDRRVFSPRLEEVAKSERGDDALAPLRRISPPPFDKTHE